MGKALRVVQAGLLAGEDQDLDALRVINGGDEYETVAASQTNQALGATGAAGDYLDKLIIVVATAATAQVQIKDGGSAAITVFPNSPGGGIGTYVVPLGLRSTSGAWQVTTLAGSTEYATVAAFQSAHATSGGNLQQSDYAIDPPTYRPLPDSPLIGAGVFTGWLLDNSGKRFRNPPSIGAYEYVRPRQIRV